jgi:hypothetical protein
MMGNNMYYPQPWQYPPYYMPNMMHPNHQPPHSSQTQPVHGPHGESANKNVNGAYTPNTNININFPMYMPYPHHQMQMGYPIPPNRYPPLMHPQQYPMGYQYPPPYGPPNPQNSQPMPKKNDYQGHNK